MAHFDACRSQSVLRADFGRKGEDEMIELETRSLPREGSPILPLRDLAAPLFRRRRALILTSVVVFAAVILAGLLMPAQFTSHMSVLVSRERLDPVVSTGATPELLNTGDLAVSTGNQFRGRASQEQ